MRKVSSPFGDERLDSDLALILNLADRGAARWNAPSVLQVAGLSRQASVTITASLGFALLASTAMLYLDRIPVKQPSVVFVSIPNSVEIKREVALPKTRDVIGPIAPGSIKDAVSLAKPYSASETERRLVGRSARDTFRRRMSNDIPLSPSTTTKKPTLAMDTSLSREPVPNPTALISSERPMLSSGSINNIEPESDNKFEVIDNKNLSFQNTKNRRASVDAIRFLRRQ